MSNYVTITSDRKASVALVLCLVGFLGIAGLHRLYAGRVITGILWLFTLGFFGIGTVIDALLIILGAFRDNAHAPLRQW